MSDLMKQFMGEVFSIKDYYTLFPEGSIRDSRYEKGTFIKFVWSYIGNMKEDDPLLDNEGIKADQSSNENDINDISYDYEINNWRASSFPPTVGTDGKWRDGRYRIIAALRNNQDWIPAALYNFEETKTPTLDMITEGLRANPGTPGHRNEMEDFIAGGVKAIDAGELIRDDDAIMFWLVSRARVDLRYSNKGGFWTNIKNRIMERTAKVGSIPLVKSRDDIKSWCNGVQGLPSNYVLYKATGGKAPLHFFGEQVLKNATNPPPVVLYTDAYTPEKCAKNVKHFVDEIKEWYKLTYALVNKDLAGGPLTLAPPKELPMLLLGVYPNIKRGNQPTLHKEHVLCDVDQYLIDGDAMTATLDIAA